MNNWQRWWEAPQTHWLRKLVFQVHLWAGIGLGLYVLVISLSGSALLLKSPFYDWFEPNKVVPTDATPLEGEALMARMAEVYAGYELGFMMPAYEPDAATYIVLQKDGNYYPHYFNQYTGENIGAANPWPMKAVQWVADLHDDLMLGDTGKTLNGVGGVLFLLMSASGVLIWWQGRTRWFEGLRISFRSSRALLWQFHSFIGFWSLFLMFCWGISGFQLGFPALFYQTQEWLGAHVMNVQFLDDALRFFRRVHFARYGQGYWINWGWILLGVLPTLLFISGFILWWRRVILRRTVSAPVTEQL